MAIPIGLQLYTVRDLTAKNFNDTVRKIADMGYMAVEPAGFPGTNPHNAAELFNELKLTVPSIHSQPPIGDKKNEILETIAALNCPYLIVPWQPKEEFETRGGIRKICDILNEANQVGKEQGFAVGYHNHWWEAEYRVDGKPAYQVMLEYLDKDIIFQIDTYWIKGGGLDPAEVVKEIGSRAPILHIKDGPAVKDQPMTAVGKGVIDWHSVIKAGSPYTKWLIVEMDSCATDVLEAVKDSYTYLTKEGLAYGTR
jgi:sugar phosphate isomerase/epimerase